MADARLILGDCVEAMATLEAESVDAIVCDPPAGVSFMGRAWDSDRGGREQWVAWLAAVMGEAFRVAKPGAHALVWALPRTSHWTGSALEDAGWEVRDIVTHLFGSGFPKSLDVSKAIDKALGAERTEVVGHKDSGLDKGGGTSVSFDGSTGRDASGLIPVTAPATPEAAAAAGWGTSLKPACEFWFLARKPFAATVAENFVEHGTGALNIGAAAVGSPSTATRMPRYGSGTGEKRTYGEVGAEQVPWTPPTDGRWPANLMLSHLPECKGNGPAHTDLLCAPGCPVAELNAMSGESSSASSSMPLPNRPGFAGERYDPGGHTDQETVRGHDDAGGAARFFYVAKPRTRERIGGTTRNLHPTVKAVTLMRWLVRLVTPPGGVVLDPFLGSGSTGCAAMVEGFRFIGIEQDRESFDTARERISDWAFAHGRERPESTA